MRTSFFLACLLATFCVALVGCSDNGFKLGKKDREAFKSAPADIKAAWEEGLQADQANDYLTASTKYRSLLGRDITPEQLVAVQTALGALNIRLNEAADKGDPAAQQAKDALNQAAPRR